MKLFSPIVSLLLAGAAIVGFLPLSFAEEQAASVLPGDPHKSSSSQPTLEQFRNSYNANPYNPVSKKNLETAVLVQSIELLKQKKFEEASVQLEYAEELYPDDPQPPFLRGNAAYQLKQYDLARTELEKSRNLGGETVDLLYLLGKVFYDTEDVSRAVELWELAVQKDPENKSLQALLVKSKRELAVDAGMGKGQSSRFILSFDAGIKSDVADRVLGTLEDAYNQVGRDFSAYPESRVPVILYTGKDYREITGSPGWSGGQYDGKIRLPVGGMTEVTPPVRGVIFHEYTHVVVRELTRGNCPVWLNEGLAEVEGKKELDYPLTVLSQASKDSTMPPLASLAGSFASLKGKSVDLAYQQSYSLVRYMVSVYGWHRMNDLLMALGEGNSFDSATEQAYHTAGRTFGEIFTEWRDRISAGQEL